jgi:Caspase domain
MLICSGIVPGHAEKRVALVVGNSAYQEVPRLANPANDAKLIADTLRALGFSLVGGKEQLDLDKTNFERAVQDFGTQLHGADVVLFYYAGHGVQVRGLNYAKGAMRRPANRGGQFEATLRMVRLVSLPHLGQTYPMSSTRGLNRTGTIASIFIGASQRRQIGAIPVGFRYAACGFMTHCRRFGRLVRRRFRPKK